jgi:hypothetical protein
MFAAGGGCTLNVFSVVKVFLCAPLCPSWLTRFFCVLAVNALQWPHFFPGAARVEKHF